MMIHFDAVIPTNRGRCMALLSGRVYVGDNSTLLFCAALHRSRAGNLYLRPKAFWHPEFYEAVTWEAIRHFRAVGGSPLTPERSASDLLAMVPRRERWRILAAFDDAARFKLSCSGVLNHVCATHSGLRDFCRTQTAEQLAAFCLQNRGVGR